MISLRTSGSTGEPKEFFISDEHLDRRVDRMAHSKGPEINTLKSIFMDVRQESTTYYRNRLWCERNEIDLLLPLVSFERTVAMLDARKPEGIITSPGSLVLYARAAGLTHRFAYIQSTGAILKPADCRMIRKTMLADGGALYSSYGASEVGSIALATATEVEIEHGCVGRVLSDVSLEIAAGKIRVKTPTMIESRLSDDGWFYPGDRGYSRPDGMLVLTGRV